MARQKVNEQRKATVGKPADGKPSDPVPAQNAARVRTGSYTGNGATKPKATPSTPSGEQSPRPSGNASKNPYGRYSASDGEEDATYTASFKPGSGKNRTSSGKKDSDNNRPKT